MCVQVLPSSLDLSKCYAIIILVLSLLYNYMWASLSSSNEARPQVVTIYTCASLLQFLSDECLQNMIQFAQMKMELLYTYLYATSIIILLVFITPSLLTQTLVKHCMSLSFCN